MFEIYIKIYQIYHLFEIHVNVVLINQIQSSLYWLHNDKNLESNSKAGRGEGEGGLILKLGEVLGSLYFCFHVFILTVANRYYEKFQSFNIFEIYIKMYLMHHLLETHANVVLINQIQSLLLAPGSVKTDLESNSKAGRGNALNKVKSFIYKKMRMHYRKLR